MAQVRTRKRGKTFSYIFEAGKQGGKRKVVEKGGFPTRAAAYKAGVEAYTDFIHGNIGITSESIPLADFMTSWLDNVVAANVKPVSMQTYRSCLKQQVIPYLGEVKVQELTPAMLDTWIHNLQKAGLAHNSISAVHALVSHALNYAVYPAQIISSNPAAFIKVPKNAPRNVIKRTIITPERFADLLAKYPFGSPPYVPLLLLYHTGMRLGEVAGLLWSDIDFKKKKITLSRQIRYISKRGNYFTTLKTKTSARYIIVDDFLLGELKAWQVRQAENEKQFGDRYFYIYREKDGHIVKCPKSCSLDNAEKVSPVCTCDNGKLFIRGEVAKILRAEGLNAHSFRHTHATQLIENGATAKGVAGRLGHADTQITQNLYTHNTLKLQEDTLAIFNKTLQNSLHADNAQTNL